MEKENKFFTVAEASRRLGCSVTYTRMLMEQFDYHVKRTVDGVRLFTDEDVENLRKLWNTLKKRKPIEKGERK